MTTKNPKNADFAYLLRTCKQDMTAHGGFKWPVKGPVKAPDWDPTPECGHGLHGLLNGEGDGSLLDWSETAKWMVVKVLKSEVVAIDADKVKVPRGTVVFVGDRKEATDYLAGVAPAGACIVGAMLTVGDRRSVMVGYRGQATAGNDGTATAGDYGTATAGVNGKATAGDGGQATAGDRGQATAGNYGEIQIRYWDNNRYRTLVGYIGENGLKPNTAYRVGNGKFVKA